MGRDFGEIDTVVIGGGQAGLAIGYHLRRTGIPFLIVDAGQRVGDAWRNRWDSLRLFTPNRYNALPGLSHSGPRSSLPGKDEIATYLERYAQHFDLPIRLGVEATRLSMHGDRFEVTFEDTALLTRNVIVATGPYNRPRIPDYAADLDQSIVQIHSKDYRNPSQLRDGRVLVVGAANSGGEIAIEVARDHHETWLSGRDPGQEPARAGSLLGRLLTPLMWFAANHVIKADNPIGKKVADQLLHPPRGIPRGRVRRKDFSAAGIERIPRTIGARDGFPMVDGERVLPVENVVWCTGFDPAFEWIDIPVEYHYGNPIHQRGVIESCPGLYFMGLLTQYSLSSPLIGGVGRDAEYVVDHLVANRRVGAVV